MLKQERVDKANDLINTIASCGRGFFYSSGKNTISHFKINHQNGRLYFVDKYSDQCLPLSHTKSKRWHQYFTEGGTLKALVEYLADYITTGKTITNQYVLGPWEEWMCHGDLWGYGEDMEKVRQKATELGITIKMQSKVNYEN